MQESFRHGCNPGEIIITPKRTHITGGNKMSRLQFIFVHGLSGWGSYDAAYQKMPYWGMRGGDLMPTSFSAKGDIFRTSAPSISGALSIHHKANCV